MLCFVLLLHLRPVINHKRSARPPSQNAAPPGWTLPFIACAAPIDPKAAPSYPFEFGYSIDMYDSNPKALSTLSNAPPMGRCRDLGSRSVGVGPLLWQELDPAIDRPSQICRSGGSDPRSIGLRAAADRDALGLTESLNACWVWLGARALGRRLLAWSARAGGSHGRPKWMMVGLQQ